MRYKYKRSRNEKFVEYVKDWISFRGSLFDDEDDFIQAMEEIKLRKTKLGNVDPRELHKVIYTRIGYY